MMVQHTTPNIEHILIIMSDSRKVKSLILVLAIAYLLHIRCQGHCSGKPAQAGFGVEGAAVAGEDF